ncbi:GlsB/YeaQ/YmgE family stress response membrane protein [Rubinisphaera sp. JC750]|uniref:GlsB/YeaQ/YmgE family stress response membrane protein n=1 Tax=Rubinisphaera sp. JC750 TaxID=2898658 RepID=UPI001F015E60|nr:GlsB/YeaQ/YmgE family stress response membrane protein [Rubinisphaera sp. JC750]
MELLIALLMWCLFGLAVGAIARFLVPGRQPMGMVGTILLGVAGSFLGGFFGFLLLGDGNPLQPAGFLASLIGAILVLALATRQRRSFWG